MKAINRWFTFASVLALALALLAMPAMAQANVNSNSTSATVNITSTESITISASPASVSLPYSFAGHNGTASGAITVSGTYSVATNHTNGIYLYSWIAASSPFLSNWGAGTINVSINGGASTPCNGATSALLPATFGPAVGYGTDGNWCGTGQQVATQAAITTANGVGSITNTTYLFAVGNLNSSQFTPGSSTSFTANFEATAF